MVIINFLLIQIKNYYFLFLYKPENELMSAV